jgi:mannonate dehydratase
MRIAIQGVREFTDDQAAFVAQLGITHINLNQYWQTVPGDGVFAFDDLRRPRDRVHACGCDIGALENIPTRFYDKVMLGLPGREEQLANVRETFRNIGRAGIPSSASTSCRRRSGPPTAHSTPRRSRSTTVG